MVDRPNEKYVNRYVRDEASEKWKDIGIELMSDKKLRAKLDNIEVDNRSSTNCFTKMFELWVKSQPNASWKQLIGALKCVDHNTLAAKIEGLLVQPMEKESCSEHTNSSQQLVSVQQSFQGNIKLPL